MNPLEALSWLLERPQQAVFQGAQSGADAYGKYSTGLQNAGVPWGISDQAAQLASLGPMVLGALGGLTGLGGRTSGADLTRDFSGAPEWDKAIGNTLDVAADPLGLIPATKAGQTADQLAGTAKRTWGSVRGAMANQPQTIAKMDERLGNWWGKYGLDIPTAPKTAADPVMVRTSEPAGVLKKKMGYKSPGGSVNEGATGFSPMDNNMIAYYANTQERTLPHELTHWATKSLPEGLNAAATHVLGGFENRFPGYIGSLRKNPSYQYATPAQVGEEALAREAGNITKWPEYANNVPLNEILKRSRAQIRPELYENAPPWGVSMAPQTAGYLDSYWE